MRRSTAWWKRTAPCCCGWQPPACRLPPTRRTRLLTTHPTFRDAEHEKAWLIRTTLHRACDIRKSAAQRNLPLEEAVLAAAPEAEEGNLLAAVRALPDKYGAVIHLYYYEGYSIQEIANLLGVPVPTVGTRLARGRERLRQLLKEGRA